MQENYNSYSAVQFLEDPFFIEWIKYQTPEADQFWTAWVSSAPANLNAMREAEAELWAILSALPVAAGERDAGQVWERIQSSLQKKPGTIGYRLEMPPVYKRWMAAAAVVLFIAAGVWIWGNRNAAENHSAVTHKSNDIAPGGDRAILTLADGSKVILDTTDNGRTIKQGSVTVVKLNGQLAYNKDAAASTTEVLYNTITTPKGGQYQLVLADGSRVWLNAASSLKFPTAFAGHERKVEITGEAYFEVAHDAAKPFTVSKGDMDVKVLGTHFNINSYSDEPSAKITLLEGRVLVKKKDKHVYLHPGQQASIQSQQDEIKVNNNTNVDEVIAWKNGRFSFNRADIKTVMRELARWYDLEVEYKGPPTKDLFGGDMQKDLPLSKVLDFLQKSQVHFEVQGRKVIVKP